MEIDLEIDFHVAEISPATRRALRGRFEHAARWVAGQFEIGSLTVSISIVDDPTIHRLNREHLQHDWPTDVVSFVFESGPRTDGEIIASWDTACRLRAAAGWAAEDELLLYVVHGLLHLAGLDDINPDQQARMRAMEQAYLQAAELPGAEHYLARFKDVSY